MKRLFVLLFSTLLINALYAQSTTTISCHSCGGSGKMICMCGGSGVTYTMFGPAPCFACGGLGVLPCFSCGGRGSITVQTPTPTPYFSAPSFSAPSTNFNNSYPNNNYDSSTTFAPSTGYGEGSYSTDSSHNHSHSSSSRPC